MRYRIHGTNSATGTQVATTVSAATKEDAAKIAAKRGILVSEVKSDEAEDRVDEGGLPRLTPAPHPPTPARQEGYLEIIRNAEILRFAGRMLVFIGWAVGIAGGVAGIAAIADHEPVAGIVLIFGGVVNAILLNVFAAFIAMIASIGIAVRDIAMDQTCWVENEFGERVLAETR